MMGQWRVASALRSRTLLIIAFLIACASHDEIAVSEGLSVDAFATACWTSRAVRPTPAASRRRESLGPAAISGKPKMWTAWTTTLAQDQTAKVD